MKTAFPLHSNPVSIRLYSNIPFDNTYKHHSLISERFTYNGVSFYTSPSTSSIAKERFIDRTKMPLYSYYYPRYDLTGEYNFDFSNGLVGSVVLELTAEQTNANYMRVKVGDITHGYEYYYYFITGISQVNADTYRLSLELDVLMTYQDEFLQGMNNVPVFTNRKHSHRYTNNGLMPRCCDLRTGEDAFSGVKPQYIIDTKQTHFKDAKYKSYLENVVWLYVCLDQTVTVFDATSYNVQYKYKGVSHPLAMACVPICLSSDKLVQIAYYVTGSTSTTTIYSANINAVMQYLVNNGNVHACKLSPYPPFSMEDIERVETTPNITFILNRDVLALETFSYKWENDKSTLRFFDRDDPKNFMYILNEKTSSFDLEDVTLSIKNASAPSITSDRFLDPKLLFEPFRKYSLSAPYGSYELYPELLYSKGYFINDTIPLRTVASSYIGDNTFFTTLKTIDDDNDDRIIFNYDIENIGLSSNANYVIPAGTNALDLFNSTQANSFYQSKTASGITAGLTIAGGVGSVIGGVASLAFGSKTMGAGLLAGGIGGISSGIASAVNVTKSTNAKIEDLKNTPDSVNVSGSSFTSDLGRSGRLLPYLVVYGCSPDVIARANDFFYNYGYQVARECYFNTELKFDNNISDKVDNNLFGRTIFNYIQTNDDITNKINYDMPLIVKQKFNSIFNNGITLWSLFGNVTLWGATFFPTLATNPDRWFMKCTLDNTEYNG